MQCSHRELGKRPRDQRPKRAGDVGLDDVLQEHGSLLVCKDECEQPTVRVGVVPGVTARQGSNS